MICALQEKLNRAKMRTLQNLPDCSLVITSVLLHGSCVPFLCLSRKRNRAIHTCDWQINTLFQQPLGWLFLIDNDIEAQPCLHSTALNCCPTCRSRYRTYNAAFTQPYITAQIEHISNQAQKRDKTCPHKRSVPHLTLSTQVYLQNLLSCYGRRFLSIRNSHATCLCRGG